MNITIRILAAILLASLITACGSYPVREYNNEQQLSVVDNARQMIGVPYYYGGTSPSKGVDCSGLVYLAYEQAGQHIPRTSLQQYRATKRVHFSQLEPGDLVFFKLGRGRISHVGIYIGNSRFIHAPKTGKNVEYASLDNDFWKRRFTAAGRF